LGWAPPIRERSRARLAFGPTGRDQTNNRRRQEAAGHRHRPLRRRAPASGPRSPRPVARAPRASRGGHRPRRSRHAARIDLGTEGNGSPRQAAPPLAARLTGAEGEFRGTRPPWPEGARRRSRLGPSAGGQLVYAKASTSSGRSSSVRTYVY
jgi:hypothetical protein